MKPNDEDETPKALTPYIGADSLSIPTSLVKRGLQDLSEHNQLLTSGRTTDWEPGDLVILKVDQVGCLLEGIGCNGEIVELVAFEPGLSAENLASSGESWTAREYLESEHTGWLHSNWFERYSDAKHAQLSERIQTYNTEFEAMLKVLGDEYNP